MAIPEPIPYGGAEWRHLVMASPKLLVLIKGSPDPDALATAWLLSWLWEREGGAARMLSLSEPSLEQNRLLIRELDIPVNMGEEALPQAIGWADGYAVVDQPSVFMEGVTGVLPCQVHVDHHSALEEPYPVGLRIRDGQSGASGSLLAEWGRSAWEAVDDPLFRRIATALTFGILTDTDTLKTATGRDLAVLDALDRVCLHEQLLALMRLEVDAELLPLLGAAWRLRKRLKNWTLFPAGLLPEDRRDSIALMADRFLERQRNPHVAVWGLIVGKDSLWLDVSLRSRQEEMDLNGFIHRITGEGGARLFKGAFQVPLDFFRFHPHPQQILPLLEETLLSAFAAAAEQRGSNPE